MSRRRRPAPGGPILTGYTESQGDQLREGADSLLSFVQTMKEEYGEANGGAGESAGDASAGTNSSSSQKARVP